MNPEEEKWYEICEKIDLRDADDIIDHVKNFKNLSIQRKFQIMSMINHMFEPTFECYMWVLRKVSTLKYIILSSSSSEEIQKNLGLICDNLSYDDEALVKYIDNSELLKQFQDKFERDEEDGEEEDKCLYHKKIDSMY